MPLGPLASCRVCGAPNPKPFFNLGEQPPANSLLRREDEKEKRYPLALHWCNECKLVQLGYTMDPKELFSNYVWVTGTSKGAQEFAEKFYGEFMRRVTVPSGGYVLEVASNDGTFLKPFMRNGHEVLGVDPARNIVEVAERNGIPTRCAFWGEEEAQMVLSERGPAHVIFARNVLPHVANTVDFVRGLKRCLHKDGVVAIEAHDARIIMDELHYDSIYHEHLCYFTFRSLERLLNDAGLYIFDMVRSPISGGSMVVYASGEKKEKSKAVRERRAEEEGGSVNELAAWERFAERARAHKEKLLEILRSVAAEGNRVVGWGASARSSTMLNFAGITTDLLPAIIDLNPLKQGLYTAGTHIPIESAEVGMRRDPTHIFILAWNFAGEIMEKLKKEFHFHGECLVPLPGEPRIVS